MRAIRGIGLAMLLGVLGWMGLALLGAMLSRGG
jgi:hypothetical protein